MMKVSKVPQLRDGSQLFFLREFSFVINNNLLNKGEGSNYPYYSVSLHHGHLDV